MRRVCRKRTSAKVDKLSEDAFDDQCTGANPRYPLIAELKQIMLDTFYGREFSEAVEEEAAAPAAAKTAVKKPRNNGSVNR